MIEPVTEKRKLQLKEASARYYLRHPDRVKARKTNYRLNNPESYAASVKRSNEKKTKEALQGYAKTARIKHSDKIAHRNAVYRERRKQSTTIWDNELTMFVFTEAKNLARMRETVTSFKWHVDHVIPLNGKNVSGLHVWNNFAVIPAQKNMQKQNKYMESSTWL